MAKQILYTLGSILRLPLVIVSDLVLAIYDGVIDTLLGPTQYGSRRERRRWSKSVRQIDRLEVSNEISLPRSQTATRSAADQRGKPVRRPLSVASDWWLAAYDGFFDLLLGPTQFGTRREIRRWSKSDQAIDRVPHASGRPFEGGQAERLQFGKGPVVNHLAAMNRKSKASGNE